MKSSFLNSLLMRMKRIFQSVRRLSVKAAVVNNAITRNPRPFEEIPGPGGKYNIPFIGAMFHFKPFIVEEKQTAAFSEVDIWILAVPDAEELDREEKHKPDVTTETLHLRLKSLVEKYGSLVRIRMGKWTVMVADPADMEHIMKTEGKHPQRPLIEIHTIYCQQTGFPKGLGSLQGEEWQKFRSPVNQKMMRAKSAQYFLPVQNEVADDLVARLKQGFTPEEMLEILYRYTCESIGVVAYNKRIGFMEPNISQEKLQILEDTRIIFKHQNTSLSLPVILQKYFPLVMKKQYIDSMNRLVKYADGYYAEAMEAIKKKGKCGTQCTDEKNFMLSLLMTKKVTTEQMTAISLELFVAGTHSTASNLQMVLYNLARNPDKQQKLYEEIYSILGPKEPLTAESLNKMFYLMACVRESFRVNNTILAGTQRILPTDIVLQGYRIPAGTVVWLMNHIALKDERFFQHPDSFIPERWLRREDGKRTGPIPVAAYQPFGFGPRQCVGRRFAEQEIYLAVVKILQTFRVSLAPGQGEVDVIYSPFVGTREPIHFVLNERL